MGRNKSVHPWLVVLLAQVVFGGELPRPRFTVRASIEMTTFGETELSPGGQHYFVVTHRGRLASNELESTISVVDAQASSVKTLVTMATSTSGDAISDVHWTSDSQRIAFLARSKDAVQRLFVVTVKNGKLRQLSSADRAVAAFLESHGTFVFTTVAPISSSQLYQSSDAALPDIELGTGRSLFGLLYPHWEEVTFRDQNQQLWQTRGSKVARRLADVSLRSRTPLLSISPDGRYLVAANKADHIPAGWQAYQPAYERASFATILAERPPGRASSNSQQPEQYILVDLEKSTASPLVEAPMGMQLGYYDATRVAWSPDSRQVALSNTFVPLDQSPIRRPCVAVVDIATHKISCVKQSAGVDLNQAATTPRLTTLDWSEQGLALQYDGRGGTKPQAEVYRYRDNAWKLTEDTVAKINSVGPALSLSIQESLNQPPVLIATNAATGTTKEIWNPNPQVTGMELGEATVYKWHDRAGHEWSGGLVKPPDYVAGRQYPLVIQTHGFNPKKFLSDGIFTTAFAAQPLASHGIVVLQVQETRTDAFLTPREPSENGCNGYLAAIEQLSSEGIADPKRVGLIGFSRTGWYVLNCLTHAPDSFAAATLAESTYMSFGEYLLNADYQGPQRAQSLAEGIGSQPFGDGIGKWLAESPGFQTNKIRAPVLFEANSPPGLIYSWDIYASMRLQSKPVEFLNIRGGEHVLRRPLERLASQQTSVDWYAFWLSGEEDPDPAKADQYARWRELRRHTVRKD